MKECMNSKTSVSLTTSCCQDSTLLKMIPRTKNTSTTSRLSRNTTHSHLSHISIKKLTTKSGSFSCPMNTVPSSTELQRMSLTKVTTIPMKKVPLSKRFSMSSQIKEDHRDFLTKTSMHFLTSNLQSLKLAKNTHMLRTCLAHMTRA